MKNYIMLFLGLLYILNLNCVAQEKIDLQKDKNLDRAVTAFVVSLSSKNKADYVKLFAEVDDFIGYRTKKRWKGNKKRLHDIYKQQFVLDYDLFYQTILKGDDMTMQLVGFKKIGLLNSNTYIEGVEILVERGNLDGSGPAYIITGPLIKGKDGEWRFVGRCKELFSVIPHNTRPK